jgi:hypothetical protein
MPGLEQPFAELQAGQAELNRQFLEHSMPRTYYYVCPLRKAYDPYGQPDDMHLVAS